MACPELSCNKPKCIRHAGLVKHWKLMHWPETGIHICETCNQSFARKADASRHIKINHPTSFGLGGW